MVVGIVAEYNPFHNGHKLQIDYAKNVLHADAVVVAMSGNFTQRGEIACFDKYTRTHAALVSGADIIFEIPAIFATSSAREFAAAGVQLLANTGIVDNILFSAETADEALFKDAAKKLVELETAGALDDEIQKLMSSGKTYAFARAAATSHYIPKEILNSPNNVLGLEYCRYIIENNIPIEINIMQRQNNNYNDTHITGEISSATAIRSELALGGDIVSVPDITYDIYKNSTFINSNDISELLHYKLLWDFNYTRYLDCTLDLADRITNNLKDFKDFSSFCNLLKTKNINYSRISRVLCHILLNITKDDFENEKESGYIRYLRMLGFSRKGATLLGRIKEKNICPLITAPCDIVNKSDIFASDIHRLVMTNKTGIIHPNEYNRKFNLVNIEN